MSLDPITTFTPNSVSSLNIRSFARAVETVSAVTVKFIALASSRNGFIATVTCSGVAFGKYVPVESRLASIPEDWPEKTKKYCPALNESQSKMWRACSSKRSPVDALVEAKISAW